MTTEKTVASQQGDGAREDGGQDGAGADAARRAPDSVERAIRDAQETIIARILTGQVDEARVGRVAAEVLDALLGIPEEETPVPGWSVSRLWIAAVLKEERPRAGGRRTYDYTIARDHAETYEQAIRIAWRSLRADLAQGGE